MTTTYALRPDDTHGAEDGAACALAWREWGDDWVVYDGMTGSSHLLDSVSGGLLGVLLEQPDRAVGLAELFSGAFGADEPPGVEELRHVQQVLTDLERMGLIRQCPA
ncbi:MAG: HPr-rel-A system PqqD family peptide chaperone [Burkholderiales bacterium]|nr:HPr-rel-A system PqqD family peptide chaperone [Burkholderiales bacterium]